MSSFENTSSASEVLEVLEWPQRSLVELSDIDADSDELPPIFCQPVLQRTYKHVCPFCHNIITLTKVVKRVDEFRYAFCTECKEVLFQAALAKSIRRNVLDFTAINQDVPNQIMSFL